MRSVFLKKENISNLEILNSPDQKLFWKAVRYSIGQLSPFLHLQLNWLQPTPVKKQQHSITEEYVVTALLKLDASKNTGVDGIIILLSAKLLKLTAPYVAPIA